MPRTKPAYPPEFKAEAVRLVTSSDRSLTRIAKDLGVADQTLRNWVQHAESDDGVREALTPNEREELRQLRREVRTLRQEREILKKPQPSSPERATRSGSGIRVRCGGEGALSGGDPVPPPGRLPKWLLRVAAAFSFCSGQGRSGADAPDQRDP